MTSTWNRTSQKGQTAAKSKKSHRAGFLPQRPSNVPRRHAGVEARRAEEEVTVVVRPGDSLWDVAAAHLGPDATDWEVACEWPRWHQENWEVIGEEPADLPAGTLLIPPEPRPR